jgi:hypothetical protein
VLALLRRLFHVRDDASETPPPAPPAFDKLTDEEMERHRRAIIQREETLRMQESKVRIKGKRPW